MKALIGSLAATALAVAASTFPAFAAPDAPEAPATARTGTHVELAGEAVELMSALVDTLASAKDAESARVAATKLDTIASSFEALATRMVAVGKPTGVQKEKVNALFRAAEKDLEERMGESLTVLLTDQEVGRILGTALEKFGQRMNRLEVMEEWTKGAREDDSESSEGASGAEKAAEDDAGEKPSPAPAPAPGKEKE